MITKLPIRGSSGSIPALDSVLKARRCCGIRPGLHSYPRVVQGLGIIRLALSCALLVPAAVHSTTKVNMSSSVDGLAAGSCVLSIQSNSYPAVEGTCATNVTGTTWFGATSGAASAYARAEVGRLRMSAASDSDSQLLAAETGASIATQTRAYSYWNDTFTVSSTSQPVGQLGEMTVLLFVAGLMDLHCDYPLSSVYFRLSVSVQDSYGATTNFAGGTQIKVGLDGTIQTLPMDGALIGPGLWPVRCQFHFGRPSSVIAWAEVFADARASATNVSQGIVSGTARSDFSHSVIWGGISDVRVGGGAAVTNFTITSDSGYNYLLGTITNVPVITRIQSLPQGLALDWTDLGPRSYTVETSPSLFPTAWAPAPGVAWPIHTNTVLLPLPAQSPAFFRIRAL